MTNPNAIPIPQDAAFRVVRAEWERVKRERDDASAEVERLRQREAMLEDLLRYMLRCSDEHVWPTSRVQEVRAVLGERGGDGSG